MMKILYTLGLFGLLTLSACSDAEPIVDEEPDFNNKNSVVLFNFLSFKR